jgi:hypothetical protein
MESEQEPRSFHSLFFIINDDDDDDYCCYYVFWGFNLGPQAGALSLGPCLQSFFLL